ncbi:MAG: hypothetical protein K8R36_14330 [Planctomycetales bacterium]|nr:hypothetical protein [Planctomycetales bacterium]
MDKLADPTFFLPARNYSMLRPATFAVAMALVLATQASAQVVVQAGGTGGAGGGTRAVYPTGQSLMYLLYYPQLQKEIDLVDDQKAELQKIQSEINQLWLRLCRGA